MHYIDEGVGEVMLFIHGTPTWSFLYRDFIQSFSKSYRCVAIDHLGFGLSDHPEHIDGTPQSHSKNLIEFIDRLGLDQMTLVVHDFGGPIGLSAGIHHHQKVRQVIAFNTWLWETKSNPEVKKVNKILHSWFGRFLYLHLNFSPKVLLKKGFHDKKKLTRNIHRQYLSPFPNKTSRHTLLNLGMSLAGSSDWYELQWEHLDKLEKKPWLFLWGTKDEFITRQYLQKWKSRLPHAVVKEFDCGHFVQEEKTVESIHAIELFLRQASKTSYP